MSERRKVTVVGAGNVGATCAEVLAARDYADVVLVDIKEGLPQGKALDINQMGAVLGYEPNVIGTNSYDETAGSSVVVITAGLPRKPGMSRDDLVSINEGIVKEVTENVVAQSPDAILIVVSNPLDAMCHVAKNVSGFPKERVIGQAGILDTARFQTFIAWETGSSVKDVTAVVLGGHGDQMVSVVSATTVGGVPLRKLVSEERIQSMIERTAKGGGEVVNLLGHLGLVRARRGRSADGRRDHARREARPALHRLPRGRVRDRRALHGRADEARRGGRRARRRARPGRRGAGGARRGRPTPSARSSRFCPRRSHDHRFATVPGEWISASRDGRRSSAAPRPGSGSHRPRRWPRRARTWRCSPAAASSSSSRPTGSARLRSAVT